MRLSRIKTDKSDSKLICEYAQKVELKLWKGNSKDEMECIQITRALFIYTKHSTMLKNKLHGEAVLGEPSKAVVKSLKRSLAQLRNLLFMCSFTACKYNKACRDLYERIVSKGKSKKLALIAVCNKLLKQAFAIAKSGLIYDANHRSALVLN